MLLHTPIESACHSIFIIQQFTRYVIKRSPVRYLKINDQMCSGVSLSERISCHRSRALLKIFVSERAL